MKRPGEGLDSEEPETKRRRVTTNNLHLDISRPLKKRVILSKFKNLIGKLEVRVIEYVYRVVLIYLVYCFCRDHEE